MKNILIAALAIAAAGSAMAASTNSLAIPTEDSVNQSAYGYALGVSTHGEVYEEFADEGILMREEAVISAIKAGVSRAIGHTGGAVMLSGVFGIGRANYIGSYMDGNYGDLRLAGLRRSLVDVTVMYKQTAPLWNGLIASAGLGYRRHVDNLQDAGPGGYKRINQRTYLVASLEQAVNFANWTIIPGVQYKHILSSKQLSDLYGGVTVDQPNGHGTQAAVAIVQHGVGYNTVITPFVRMWDIEDSDVHSTGLYEPRNKTKEFGIAVTYQF